MARILFEDDFTGTTGAAWSATKWATRAVGGGTGACTIQSNAGRMRSTGAWTGVAGKALVDKLDDFDMVCKFTNATTTGITVAGSTSIQEILGSSTAWR